MQTSERTKGTKANSIVIEPSKHQTLHSMYEIALRKLIHITKCVFEKILKTKKI